MTDDPIVMLASVRRQPSADPSRPHFWPLIIIVLVLLASAVAFFGPRSSDATPGISPTVSGTPDREARVYQVSYRFGVFSPTNLRIHAGDTVRFRNDSPLPIRITAQLQPGQKLPDFDSVGDVQPGSYFSYTFAKAGIYGYYNHSNPNEAGVIIVR